MRFPEQSSSFGGIHHIKVKVLRNILDPEGNIIGYELRPF